MPEAETVRDLRRTQILEVARDLVAERGFEALTYSALEARLSFSRGVITHHFRNKHDIVTALLRASVREVDSATVQAVTETADHAERIRRTIRSNVRGFLDREAALRVLITFLGQSQRDPKMSQFTSSLLARWRRWTAKVLEGGVAGGAFRSHDTEAMAGVIVGQILGLVMQEISAPGAFDLDLALTMAEESALASLQVQTGNRVSSR